MDDKLITAHILNFFPYCVYWKDIHGVYLGCNRMEAELVGLKSPEEIIGKTDYDLFLKDDADALIGVDQRVMQTKIMEEVTEYVTLPRTSDIKVTILTRKSPLYDDKNNVIGTIGVSNDITECKRQIWTSINSILKYIPGCIYCKDKNGVYMGCNQMEAELLGLKSYKKIIGKTDYDLLLRYAAEVIEKTDQRIMLTRLQEEMIEQGTLLNGKNVIMLTKKSPLYDDKNNIIGIIGVSIDITDRKDKEELEVKLKLQEELYRIAKEVSHDIASPVSSLKIIDELYEGKLLDEDKRMLKAAITSIEKMAGKMLSKYRLNERIERGEEIEIEEKKEEEYVNVDESLWNIVEEMRYRNKGRKVDVEIKYGNEKGNKILFVRGDGIDFERMISNIINNGIEAVEGKKAEIEVRYEEKGEEVEIRIKDNGEGMPKKMAEKLLKGEEIGTTKKDGYGIGTQQIINTIKAMNGQLKIKSKENLGTEFILSFKKQCNN